MPKRSKNMSNDTEERNLCKPQTIHDCPHYTYVDVNSPEVNKYEDFIHAGVELPPQTIFHIQRIADQEFPKDNPQTPHPGNRAKAIQKLLKYGINRYNSVKKRGTFQEIMEGVYDESGELEKEELNDRIESLEEHNKRLEERLDEKKEELKQVKRRHEVVTDNSDIVIHVLDAVSKERLTLDQIFHKLKDEKGIEFREYKHPEDSRTSIGLKGLIDYFLQNLVERKQVEVSRENGKTVYGA
jgi:hypothetical protein